MSFSALHDPERRAFASDNYSGAHPDVLAAVVAANDGHLPPYGDDVYTAALRDVIREHFGEAAEIYPVFNGTGANVVGLSAVLPRAGAAVAPIGAHINTSEGAAPEQISGIKILGVHTDDGKLAPADIVAWAPDRGNEQRAQPHAVSISQTTELGTVYEVDEIAALCATAHDLGLAVHVDGSRLWNASAALGRRFREFTTEVGVDVVSVGGTKNGALAAEAVVVLNPERVTGVGSLRKSATQLCSKMRFISAQFLALFDDDLGLRNALHANAMAARLRTALEDAVVSGRLPGLTFAQPTDSNVVFARLPVDIADRIRERVHFYDWNREAGEVRWMTAWDTSPDDVDRFVDVIARSFGNR
ncbi:threonine aldolase family protein [Gordonia sp. NPDC003425]